ncbi:MAG: GntR family transcriptional regulator [Actinobacteria bacterium]|nr:GntR family transcriptional regulator [Actinomycetota bacterium]
MTLVIIDAIRGGVYGVGDFLPRERELAAQLEVSRPVLREGLNVLINAGILVVSRGPNGGAKVNSVEHLAKVQSQIRGDSISTLRDLLEARRFLETWGFVKCGERASDRDLEDLTVLADQLGIAVERGDPCRASWEQPRLTGLQSRA